LVSRDAPAERGKPMSRTVSPPAKLLKIDALAATKPGKNRSRSKEEFAHLQTAVSSRADYKGQITEDDKTRSPIL